MANSASHPEKQPALGASITAGFILVASGLLLFLSPKDFSENSATAFADAVLGAPMVAAKDAGLHGFLRAWVVVGEWLGLGNVPHVMLRVAGSLTALACLVCVFGFFRLLGARAVIAALGACGCLLAATPWREAGQFTNTILSLACISAAAWAAAWAGGRAVGQTRPPVAPLILCMLLAALSVFAQLSALAVVPAVAAIFVTTTYRAADRNATAETSMDDASFDQRERVTRAYVWSGVLLTLTLVISCAGFVASWYAFGKPTGSFRTWLLTTGVLAEIRAGQSRSEPVAHLVLWARSWCGSWLPHCDVFGRSMVVGLAVVLCAGLAPLTWSAARRRGFGREHVVWLLAWLVPSLVLSLFLVPRGHNLFALALIPQMAVVVLAAEHGLRKNVPSLARRIGLRVGALGPLAGLVMLVVVANTRLMLLPALREDASPDAEFRVVRSHVPVKDTLVIEAPNHRLIRALAPPHSIATRTLAEASAADIPTSGAQRGGGFAVHESSVFPNARESALAPREFARQWAALLRTAEQQAGGRERLRGGLVFGPTGELLLARFGHDTELPLTATLLYHRLAVLAAAKAQQNEAAEALSSVFMDQLTDQEIAALWTANGTATETLVLPSMAPDGAPLWAPGTDVRDARSAGNGDALEFLCRGDDPYVFTTLAAPVDLRRYSRMVVDLAYSIPGARPARDEAAHLGVSFGFDETNPRAALLAAELPMRCDGDRHEVEFDLRRLLALHNGQKITSVRLDTGATPGALVTLHRVEFRP